jgi:hypothetical protein
MIETTLVNMTVVPVGPGYGVIYEEVGDDRNEYLAIYPIVAWRIETYSTHHAGQVPGDFFSVCVPLDYSNSPSSRRIGIKTPDGKYAIDPNASPKYWKLGEGEQISILNLLAEFDSTRPRSRRK